MLSGRRPMKKQNEKKTGERERERGRERKIEKEVERAVILQAERSLVNIVQYKATVKPLGCLKNAGYLSITAQPRQTLRRGVYVVGDFKLKPIEKLLTIETDGS